jgi:molecular chaperone IbpA
MTILAKYNTANLQKFLDDVEKYSIGMDEWFHRFNSLHQTESNYPPFNTIQESNVFFRVEVALAGFKKKEISVYTENNKLFVEGQKEEDSDSQYLHRGLAQRSFTRSWTLPDDLKVEDVSFEDGLLTIRLHRIVPEHQRRKDYL